MVRPSRGKTKQQTNTLGSGEAGNTPLGEPAEHQYKMPHEPRGKIRYKDPLWSFVVDA